MNQVYFPPTFYIKILFYTLYLQSISSSLFVKKFDYLMNYLMTKESKEYIFFVLFTLMSVNINVVNMKLSVLFQS